MNRYSCTSPLKANVAHAAGNGRRRPPSGLKMSSWKNCWAGRLYRRQKSAGVTARYGSSIASRAAPPHSRIPAASAAAPAVSVPSSRSSWRRARRRKIGKPTPLAIGRASINLRRQTRLSQSPFVPTRPAPYNAPRRPASARRSSAGKASTAPTGRSCPALVLRNEQVEHLGPARDRGHGGRQTSLRVVRSHQ